MGPPHDAISGRSDDAVGLNANPETNPHYHFPAPHPHKAVYSIQTTDK